MRSLTFAASQPQYIDHLAPVWHAMPPELRGPMIVSSKHHLAVKARGLGIEIAQRLPSNDAVIVAGWADSRRIPRPIALLEHGAGQQYLDVNEAVHASYSGGRQREHISLFLCPSEMVASRAHTAAKAVVVGAPILDEFHRESSARSADTPTTIAIAFHWNCGVSPESRWALPHYHAALPSLVTWCREQDYRLVAHGHPRSEGKVRPMWQKFGVPWVEHDQVLREADLLIVDNSSLGYEFASLGKPVLWLNAPWYRKNVHHGLRFWNCIPGWQISDPGDLFHGIEESFNDPIGSDYRVIPDVYAYADGKAAERSATALVEWLEQLG